MGQYLHLKTQLGKFSGVGVNGAGFTFHPVFTAPGTITLTASAADADGTVAKVDFYQGTTLVGTATTAPYTFTLTNVAAGTYSLTARATDNRGAATTSAAVSIIVNTPPTVSITTPAANAVFTAPASITITAAAADADGTVAKVDFYQGTTLIGTATGAPFTFNWTNVAAGTYSLTAVATDNRGAATTSAAVSVTVNSGVAQVYYIYTDQLNTPRVITDTNATPVWRWDNQDPFGANVPDEDPDGDGVKFTCNLRFPGQYADRETFTHYNYFRDYDPSIGRYAQSDPIGLFAGPNTYAYVGGNPVNATDPRGNLGPLAVIGVVGLVGAIAEGGVTIFNNVGNGLPITNNLLGALAGGFVEGAIAGTIVVGLPAAAAGAGAVGLTTVLNPSASRILTGIALGALGNLITVGKVIAAPAANASSQPQRPGTCP